MLPKYLQLLQPGATPDKMPRRQLFSLVISMLPLLAAGKSNPEQLHTNNIKKTGYGAGPYGG